MDKREFLISKLHELVKTAYGCTEIGAIAYPCAAAYAQANNEPIEELKIEISSNIYKNVSRVGVPNLGFCGVSMIAAAGAIIAEPERKLEMFATITEQQKQKANDIVVEKRVKVVVPKEVDPVYAKATIITKRGTKVEALIEGIHDNLVYVKKNGKVLFENKTSSTKKGKAAEKKAPYGPEDFRLTDLIDLASSLQQKDLEFLEEVFKVNVELSEYGKNNIIPGSFTHIFKRTYPKMSITQKIVFDTVAAIDARMAGVPLPVMSSCGSGDHGLTLSIPQYSYYKYMKNDKLRFLQGLALANLVTWKIKSAIGELSAFCGSIIASVTGALVGTAYQKHFSDSKIRALINSCMSSYALALCDGAKMSCTFKIAAALIQGTMIFETCYIGFSVKPKDGVVGETPSQALKIFKAISEKHSKDINHTLVQGLNEINKE